MGNCSTSEHHAKLFKTENFSNDPLAFRVFIKKRNKKFVPGWLKINDEEIIFSRGQNNFQFWPLAYLRRYGYTCSDIFFFESGRRCATGEGLHTFQSHQAERIFHVVQSKIKIEEYTRGSRASSVVSNRAVSSVVNPLLTNRIHPVQRFSSEGANNDFLLSANANPRCSAAAPPSYGTYHRNLQANLSFRPADKPSNSHTMDRHRKRLPSISSTHSVIVRSNGDCARERPRSVVSAFGQSVSSAAALSVPSPTHQINSVNHLMPSSASMAGSYSSCLMNQSYNSTICGSSWASQQQLEGEIVSEHVLNDRHQRYQQACAANSLAAHQRNHHSYVNVDLAPKDRQEVHRTNKVRQDFLSSQPDGFLLRGGEKTGVRTPSATSNGSTVTSLLPPMSPSGLSSSLESQTAVPRQQSFCLYTGRPKASEKNGIVSASAIAAFSAPSAPNLGQERQFSESGNTNRSYTIAVGRQEAEQHKLSNGGDPSIVAVNNKEIGLNYALIDFDKTKTLAGLEKAAQQNHLTNRNYS